MRVDDAHLAAPGQMQIAKRAGDAILDLVDSDPEPRRPSADPISSIRGTVSIIVIAPLLSCVNHHGPQPVPDPIRERGGRQERTGRPADKGGAHPKGRNEEEDRRSRLRRAAAGLEGSDRPHRWPEATHAADRYRRTASAWGTIRGIGPPIYGCHTARRWRDSIMSRHGWHRPGAAIQRYRIIPTT